MNIDITNGNPIYGAAEEEEEELRRKLIEIGYYCVAISVGRGFLYPGSPTSTLWIHHDGNLDHQTILMVDGDKLIKQAKKSNRKWRQKVLWALVTMNQGNKKSFDEIMRELTDFYNSHDLDDDERVKTIKKEVKKLRKLRQMETDKEAIDRLNAEKDALEEELEVVKDVKMIEECVANDNREITGISKKVPTRNVAQPDAPLDPKAYVNEDKAN